MRSALLMMFLTTAHLWAGPASLELAPTAQVRGNVVRLADVAEVASGADPRLLRVELARAPEPGHTLRLTRARIRGTLAAYGYDASSVRVRGARVAVVAPEVTRLDPVALRSLATRFVHEELAQRYGLAVPVEVSAPEDPWVVPIGRERSALHVRWLVQPGSTPPREAYVEVVVTLDGEERALRTLLAQIELPAPPAPPPGVEAPATGGPAASGPAVVAGQRVRTRVQVGALTVYSEGVAVEDAPLDGRVAVQVASGPLREGRVVGPGLVEITGAGTSQ